MLRVLTLPITPGKDRSFLTLFTPFVADFIAKEIGGVLTVMLNTVGIKSNARSMSAHDQWLEYRAILDRLGMGSVDCTHDGTDSFEAGFQKQISCLKSSSLLHNVRKQISWCLCGRVEVPTEVVYGILANQRSKSLIAGSTFATAQCRICGSLLQTAHESVKVLRFPKIKTVSVPGLYRKELESISERITRTETIVTRLHRHDVQYDTDFRWGGYVSHLANPGDHVVLVSSPTTLNQALRVVAFTRLISPEIEFSLLIHPLIRVIDDRVIVSQMNIENFLAFMESSLQVRMFLGLGLQWGASETKLHTRDIQLVRNTSMYFEQVKFHPIHSLRPCQFGRIDICTLYKQIRCKKSLSSKQSLLSYCIQPSL